MSRLPPRQQQSNLQIMINRVITTGSSRLMILSNTKSTTISTIKVISSSNTLKQQHQRVNSSQRRQLIRLTQKSVHKNSNNTTMITLNTTKIKLLIMLVGHNITTHLVLLIRHTINNIMANSSSSNLKVLLRQMKVTSQ
jgi:hypothetical protein